MTINLDEVILINESKIERVAGDVSPFKNAYRAAEALEIIDVQNGEYFAYRLNGIKLRVEIHGRGIRFAEDSDSASMEMVRSLLVQTAAHVLRTRVRGINKAEAQEHYIDLGQLSTLDLVQLVGFSA